MTTATEFSAINDMVSATNTDGSRGKQMTTTISHTLQSLIDAHDNPFVLIDERYSVIAANSAYRAVYGLSVAEVVGRPCYEVSHKHDTPCWQRGEACPHIEIFKHRRACQLAHTHFCGDGHIEQVQIKGYLIPQPDGSNLLGEAIVRLGTTDEAGGEPVRLVGHAPTFVHAVEQLTRAAESNANVLLHGESGVGKELAAHFMHHRSERRDGPFMAVDCAALTESLFESEAFGHERGAFTGCVGLKKGLFELTDKGTLFLDEVGELSPSMQAKLLRVLETGEFRRVGGRDMLHSDVRVITATNRELRSMVEQGAFREDLYYRLACVKIELPPLRARRSDIPALADVLLARINQAARTNYYLSSEALDKLVGYDFPGNVRELRNVLQRAVALSNGSGNGAVLPSGIVFDHYPGTRAATEPMAVLARNSAEQLPTIRDVETRYLADLLQRYGGHRRSVAEAMGISERTLYRKLKRYGLN
jgi:two-component system, NtrC family, response regulator AtoC